MKKYTVTYVSGATGYGWKSEYDTLADFENFVDEKRKDYTARVLVWDNILQKFIFWKDCLSYTARIDMLHSFLRDMRTNTREKVN